MERVLSSKGAATRQRIIEGAAALIRERGVANVSLDDIRAATSTSKSQLFHYFSEGKSDLLLAVAGHEAEQILADQQPMLGDLTTWPKWQAWRRRVIEKYDAQRRRCPLSALTAQLGMGNPATQAIVTDLYDRWHAHLVTGVKALADTGEIDPNTDADQAATALLTAVTGGATLLQATDRITYLEVALTAALDDLRSDARPRREASAA
ncbi:TetR/AcrR family transcriptional regulator [Streptosporangium lutulentum]|uniref:AcrR family transcriptional regulator n=1 Tax=Streptosporangium lutulentum TaxID=1461250 RepID=A0ABT9QHY2_9ACTN|nr:TetR/AcrR family transcriptional regulator [Streptosporangium lutulentum]MDP9845674.1 AcrR family transcriptional regulator [Streptosporangium lutulentum]